MNIDKKRFIPAIAAGILSMPHNVEAQNAESMTFFDTTLSSISSQNEKRGIRDPKTEYAERKAKGIENLWTVIDSGYMVVFNDEVSFSSNSFESYNKLIDIISLYRPYFRGYENGIHTNVYGSCPMQANYSLSDFNKYDGKPLSMGVYDLYAENRGDQFFLTIKNWYTGEDIYQAPPLEMSAVSQDDEPKLSKFIREVTAQMSTAIKRDLPTTQEKFDKDRKTHLPEGIRVLASEPASEKIAGLIDQYSLKVTYYTKGADSETNPLRYKYLNLTPELVQAVQYKPLAIAGEIQEVVVLGENGEFYLSFDNFPPPYAESTDSVFEPLMLDSDELSIPPYLYQEKVKPFAASEDRYLFYSELDKEPKYDKRYLSAISESIRDTEMRFTSEATSLVKGVVLTESGSQYDQSNISNLYLRSPDYVNYINIDASILTPERTVEVPLTVKHEAYHIIIIKIGMADNLNIKKKMASVKKENKLDFFNFIREGGFFSGAEQNMGHPSDNSYELLASLFNSFEHFHWEQKMLDQLAKDRTVIENYRDFLQITLSEMEKIAESGENRYLTRDCPMLTTLKAKIEFLNDILDQNVQ